MPADTTTSSPARGISRRTVARSAVWAVPAVTLVTAAPAFAISSEVGITSFTATYLNNPNAATVDPTKLVVAAAFANTLGQATRDLQFTLTIPANLYASAPTATTPSGWGAPSVAGSFAAGWTITFTAGTQLAPGATGVPFTTTLTFTDPAAAWTDAPFRRWGGQAFSLAGTATATNAAPRPASAPVAATPDVQWQWANWTVKGAGSIGVRPRVEARVGDLWNAGRSSTGQITLVVEVARSGGASVFGNTPKPTPENTDAKWDFISSNVATTPNGPWRYTFRSKVAGYAPTSANGGPPTDFDGPASNNSFYTEIMGNYAFGDTTVSASGKITISAPHAVTVTL